MAVNYTRDYVSSELLGTTTKSDGGFDLTESEVSTLQRAISNPFGIEAIPYQFAESVDRRYRYTSSATSSTAKSYSTGTLVGRKYSEKIMSRYPLLFLAPCTAKFMGEFKKEQKTAVLSSLITGSLGEGNVNDIIEGTGRYYTPQFAYAEYYEYLNLMLRAVAIYLNIGDVKIKMGDGSYSALSTADWSRDTNSDFKTFFSSSENLIFYVDSFNQVSQSFSNDTTDSALASAVNGIADQVNELKFLFSADGGAISGALNITDSGLAQNLAESIGDLSGALGGGIVDSVVTNSPNTFLNGGKIIFPQIWSNSTTDDGSSSFDFKLRSPDHDVLSIYLNVLKPYCKLLCLTLPHMTEGDPTSYNSPFLVKAYLKGKFAVDFGMITSMSVTKGAECQWNDDGLPTQIDVSLEIKNLYSNLSIPRTQGLLGVSNIKSIVGNTAYMDFLANMSGMNIAQMEIGRKIEYAYYLGAGGIISTPSRIFTKGSESISRIFGNLYNRLS